MKLLDARLQAFLCVARSGTVFAAAGRLRLTQTAVTQRVRGLERDLGTTLFTRSRRGMKLTAEGQALLRYCNGAEELEGAVKSRLSGKLGDTDVQLTIAAPTSAMSDHLVKGAGALMSLYPHLYLHVLIDDHADRIELVRQGRADLALVPPHQIPLEMDSKRLPPDRYLLACSPSWRGRKLEDILAHERIVDFDEGDRTTLAYLEHFRLARHVARPRLYFSHNLGLIELVLAGVGYSALTVNIAQRYLDSGRLVALNRGRAHEVPLALAWYPRPQMPAYFRAAIDAIR